MRTMPAVASVEPFEFDVIFQSLAAGLGCVNRPGAIVHGRFALEDRDWNAFACQQYGGARLPGPAPTMAARGECKAFGMDRQPSVLPVTGKPVTQPN
jgi:hypothetical protein